MSCNFNPLNRGQLIFFLFSLQAVLIVFPATTFAETPSTNKPANYSAVAISIDVKGRITDQQGQALEGITVSVKGSARATSTNADGIFVLNRVDENATLVVTGVSIYSIEIPVNRRVQIDVVVQTRSAEQTEVVVTALGITRRSKTLVYATQTVKPSELTEVRDANNVLNSFQGKIANATISQGSGGVGSGARIVMRGNRSIQGSSNALIVVDGVPFNNSTTSSAGSDFGSIQSSDGASNINPDDIASVTVLRGASAAALYGSQAGNGVIIITTKKGIKDKVSVTLNSGVVTESPFALPDFQNSYGQGNSGILDASSGESWGEKLNGQSYVNYLGKQSVYSAEPDNVRDFFRKGLSLNNSLAISGGTEKAQTYFSYTNNVMQGIIPANNLTRHTVNLRVSNQITSRLSTDVKITYINQIIRNRPRTGEENAPVLDIYQIPRNVSLNDAKLYDTIDNIGLPRPVSFPSTLNSIYQNPYWMINRTSINEGRDRLIGFLSAKYKLTDWLNITARANLDRTRTNVQNSMSEGTKIFTKAGFGGEYIEQNVVLTDQWYDAILQGNNTITKDVKVNYNVGFIFQDRKFDARSISAGGLNIPNNFSLSFAQSAIPSADFTQVQTQSGFAQVNLSYKDAVFIDGSVRNDWDSRLPGSHSYLYSSLGLSVVLSDLTKLPAAVSFLKTSINYAEVGNGGQFGLLNSVYAYESGGTGAGYLSRSATLPIAGLKPEIVKNFEVGAEARFIDDRIGFTATYYNSNSFNQLLLVSLPVGTGYVNQYINAGNIQNRGFELVVTGSPLRTTNFNWDLSLNFALNRNKVVALSEDVKVFYLGGSRAATPKVEEGKQYGDLSSLTWQKDTKGNYVVDADGKPLLTTEEEYLGNFNPKETIGFTNTFTYKKASLRILLDGRIGGTIVSGTEMNLAFSGITKATENYREGNWSLGGVDADGAAVNKTITSQDFWQVASGKRAGAGSFFAYDATSFRVREVSLGYALIEKNTSFIKTLRLSLVARNLLWLYRGSSQMDIPGLGKRKMWFDPDMSLGNGNYQGIEYGTMPSTRSFGLNLQAIF